MQILDEDMQMVRSWLEDAPEYIKGHFENLLGAYEGAAARVEDLQDEVDKMRGASVERDGLQEQIDALEVELDERNSDQDSALETVKYWLHDVLVLKRPMQKPPREILRIVEEAL